jgi:tRNA pseudouridine55 synthase
MEGALLLDKPANWTSFDAVNYIRGVISRQLRLPKRQIKVGHSGTLDPFATGLLIILIGKNYTRQANKLLKLDKTYLAKAQFGAVSSTGDPEGVIRPFAPTIPKPDTTELINTLNLFKGRLEQIPPAFSAVKVNGRRAYQLSRKGHSFELKPRPITVKDIHLVRYGYPEAEIELTVSSGTYIRTLIEDIGRELGCGAYTTVLKRLSIGDYSLSDAVKIEQISERSIADCLIRL